MNDERPSGRLLRRGAHEREFAPADTVFVRLRHQAALLAAAAALVEAPGGAARMRWAALLHDYALASDRVVSGEGDIEAETLGWLKPRGVVALLAIEECSDDQTVEHVAAALAAMNAVTLTVDEKRSARLRPLVDVLARLMPDAFAELPVQPRLRYPPGVVAAVLTPDMLYPGWNPPLPLRGPARDDDDRLELLVLYGRVRQLSIPMS